MKGGTYNLFEYKLNKSVTITSSDPNEVVNINKNTRAFNAMFRVNSTEDIEININSLNFFNPNNRRGEIIYASNISNTNKKINVLNSSFQGMRDIVLRQESGSLTVQNSTFKSLTGTSYGIAVNAWNAMVTIENSLFDSNNITRNGGIVKVFDSTLYSNNNTFINNSAPVGGAIHTSGTQTNNSLTVINNTKFINNTAQLVGGAITSIYGGKTIINNSIFKGNYAKIDGGAIYNDHTLTILNTTIINNTANILTGGLYSPFSKAVIENSIISQNIILNPENAIEFSQFKDIYMPILQTDVTEQYNPNAHLENITMNITHNYTDEEGNTIYSYCVEPAVLSRHYGIQNVSNSTEMLIGHGGMFNNLRIGELLKIFVIENHQKLIEGKIGSLEYESVINFISGGIGTVYGANPLIPTRIYDMFQNTIDLYESGLRYPDQNAYGKVNPETNERFVYDFFQHLPNTDQNMFIIKFKTEIYTPPEPENNTTIPPENNNTTPIENNTTIPPKNNTTITPENNSTITLKDNETTIVKGVPIKETGIGFIGLLIALMSVGLILRRKNRKIIK